jgi:hypothetical protein
MVSNVRLVSVRYEFISSTQAYQICSSFGSRRLWNWKPKRSWPTCSTCGFLTAALAWSGMVAAPSGRSRPGSGRCRSRVFAFAIVRGSRSLDALLPILFSTGDFQEALAALLGNCPGLLESPRGDSSGPWPSAAGWMHRAGNPLDKVPKSVQAASKTPPCARSTAPRPAPQPSSSRSTGPNNPRAADCLTKDREVLLAFYEFPAKHWDHNRPCPLAAAVTQNPA